MQHAAFTSDTDETLQQVQNKSFLAAPMYQFYRGRISSVALISWLSGAPANHPFLFYDDISGTIFPSFFFSFSPSSSFSIQTRFLTEEFLLEMFSSSW